jgi:hypothetical protein
MTTTGTMFVKATTQTWLRPSFNSFSMYALCSDHGEALSTIFDGLSTFVGDLKATSVIARHLRTLDNDGEATTKLLSIIAVDNPKRCCTIALNVHCHNEPVAMNTVYSVATDPGNWWRSNHGTNFFRYQSLVTDIQIFVGTKSLATDTET